MIGVFKLPVSSHSILVGCVFLGTSPFLLGCWICRHTVFVVFSCGVLCSWGTGFLLFCVSYSPSVINYFIHLLTILKVVKWAGSLKSGLGRIWSLKVEWESLGISTKRPVSSFHPVSGKCCLPHQQTKDAASRKPLATVATLMMDCPLPSPQPLRPLRRVHPEGTWDVKEQGTGPR